MKSKLIFVFVFVVLTVCGQNKNTSVFNVSLYDFEVHHTTHDSLASALVIYEFGKSYIDDSNFDLIYQVKKKVKILNKTGLENAIIVLDLYNDKKDQESLESLNATTHNVVNGEIINSPISKENIYKEKINDNFTQIKFTMPNIQVGSIITYNYKLRSPFLYKYKPWYFQSNIPKLYSEYQASIPANLNYNLWLNGDLKIDFIDERKRENCATGGGQTSADCFDGTYIMKNIPAFLEEEYIPSKKNYMSRLEYELISTVDFDGSIRFYNRLDHELKSSPSFGVQMKKGSFTRNLIDKSSLKGLDDLNKAKLIFDYVKNNYTWNTTNFGVFKENSVKELIHNKSGNVCEINLLLHNLLKANKIECFPVALSTRENGLINTKKPRITDFNYIIIQVNINRKEYFLDATDDLLDFGQLPFKCYNQHGRLFDFEKGSKWIPINIEKPALIKHNIKIYIEDSGIVNGEVELTSTGHHAFMAKKAFYNNNELHLNAYKQVKENIEVSNLRVDSINSNLNGFKQLFDIRYEIEKLGEMVVLNPFLAISYKSNPLKSNDRKFPLDFGMKQSYEYMVTVKLGNFEVIENPKNLDLKLPDNQGTLSLTYKKEDNLLKLKYSFTFNKAIYKASFYSSLKGYIEQIVNIENNSIILLKKK